MSTNPNKDMTLFQHHEVADVLLAEITGWTGVKKLSTLLWGHGPKKAGIQPLPRPTQDWGACGPLLARHGLHTVVDHHKGLVAAIWGNPEDASKILSQEIAHHSDADAALRYAIVLAAYQKERSLKLNPDQYMAAVQAG